ncbi:MAG: molybdopterin-synthase adenylyltransferase MoeB [Oligoflexales bacterium]
MPSISQKNRSLQDFITNARTWVTEIQPEILKLQLESPPPPLVVDVRDAEDFRQGHISKAINLPRGSLEIEVRDRIPEFHQNIILYCAGGTRSLLAATTLKEMGYKSVFSLAGGVKKWLQLNYPLSKSPQLNQERLERYRRHLHIPEIGEPGQLKLLGSKVLVIGAGGLGCPSAYYLAAAGIGTLGIIDSDKVELSNLQRQILHSTDRIGMSKVESAAWTLRNYNPDIHLRTMNARLDHSNAEKIISDYDLIIDGSDNLTTRYLVNDTCLELGKPWIYGSVYRFEGQLSVFTPGKGNPCYRCLYPSVPAPGMSPSCAEAGVLGVLPGIIGLLQAGEAIKQLVNLGQSLSGRLLTFNSKDTSFKEFKLKKRSDCLFCNY